MIRWWLFFSFIISLWFLPWPAWIFIILLGSWWFGFWFEAWFVLFLLELSYQESGYFFWTIILIFINTIIVFARNYLIS